MTPLSYAQTLSGALFPVLPRDERSLGKAQPVCSETIILNFWSFSTQDHFLLLLQCKTRSLKPFVKVQVWLCSTIWWLASSALANFLLLPIHRTSSPPTMAVRKNTSRSRNGRRPQKYYQNLSANSKAEGRTCLPCSKHY